MFDGTQHDFDCKVSFLFGFLSSIDFVLNQKT